MSNLEGTSYYSNITLSEIITENVITFIRYGLLELGAYYNIYKGQLDLNGTNESLLRPVVIQGTSNYKIYRGFKNDWIWETGVNLKATGGRQPIQISGIFVNDVFYATGTAVNGTGYVVDYSRGQVVFNHPLPGSYKVECPHSIRWVQVYPNDGYEYRKVVYDWLNNPSATGLSYDNELKAYLPALFLGVKRLDTIKGIELGSRGKVSNAEIQFDVLASNSADRDRLLDICYHLETKSIPFFRAGTAPKPLTSSGTLSSGALTWPQLISQYSLSNNPRFEEDALISRINDRLLPISRGRASIGLSIDVYPA